MKMSLMQYLFYRGEGSRGGEGSGGGDVRRVVFREEREEERYVIRSITLHFRTKFQYLLTS